MRYKILSIPLIATLAWIGYVRMTPGVARASAGSDLINAWIEFGASGPIARAVVSGTSCPLIVVNSQAANMAERAAPSANFPGRVCEQNVPVDASISIEDKPLAVPTSHPKKIVIVGDTGCRIEVKNSGKTKIQNCNDTSSGWPFPKIAQAAAFQHPDLVVHVGDYHYREAECPEGDEDCDGSVDGDVWASWSEDFFTPAKPLLDAAPWIFVRGNHEACSRAYAGYFRFLDSRPMADGCDDVIPPYTLTFQNFTAAVLDSSFGDWNATGLQTVASLPVNGAWLLTHRPPWISESAKSFIDPDGDDEEGHNGGDNHGDKHPVGNNQPVGVANNISFVVTGHEHLFRAATFADNRPPQIISGNGGTFLDKMVDEPNRTAVDAGTTSLASIKNFGGFGFMVLQETAPSKWQVIEYDLAGNAVIQCALSFADGPSAQLSCN